MDPNDVTWKHAEAYFKENPQELVGCALQWASKDDRKAARGIITHWLKSPHVEVRNAGEIALDAWTEMFYGWKDCHRDDPRREAWDDWAKAYARRESA